LVFSSSEEARFDARVLSLPEQAMALLLSGIDQLPTSE
jgi:hypothetical protein